MRRPMLRCPVRVAEHEALGRLQRGEPDGGEREARERDRERDRDEARDHERPVRKRLPRPPSMAAMANRT